jgi:hypothetical protein
MATPTTPTSTFPIPASERVHSTTTSTTPTAPVATTAVPSTTVKAVVVGGHPAPHTSKHSETLSTAAIAVAVVAAVLVLACIGWALARRRAIEPHWLLSLRHSMAEAGFRASATWAEFSDWVRLGH